MNSVARTNARREYARQRNAGFDHQLAVAKTAERRVLRPAAVEAAVRGWRWWEGEKPRFYQPEPAGLGAFE